MTYERDVYVKSALVGLALLLAGSATYSVALLIADPARLVIELVIWVPALVLAATLWFWRRWGLVVAALIGAIAGLALFSELDLDLIPLRAFFDFVPTVLALSGVLVVLGASLVGTIQHFRGRVSTDATRVMQAPRLGASSWCCLRSFQPFSPRRMRAQSQLKTRQVR